MYSRWKLVNKSFFFSWIKQTFKKRREVRLRPFFTWVSTESKTGSLKFSQRKPEPADSLNFISCVCSFCDRPDDDDQEEKRDVGDRTNRRWSPGLGTRNPEFWSGLWDAQGWYLGSWEEIKVWMFAFVAVRRWGRGEDKESSGDLLQQPAVRAGAHQEPAEERPEVLLVHAGQSAARKWLHHAAPPFTK